MNGTVAGMNHYFSMKPPVKFFVTKLTTTSISFHASKRRSSWAKKWVVWNRGVQYQGKSLKERRNWDRVPRDNLLFQGEFIRHN